MPKVKEICRHIRTKNAGPFWVTVDFFFRDEDAYRKYAGSDSLGPDLFQRLFGADPLKIKRIPIDSLNVVKISYVRPKPQAWMGERDMHSGQLFARLLDVEVEAETTVEGG